MKYQKVCIAFQKRIFVDPYMNECDPIEVDMLYHQSVTDVFECKVPLTKEDAVSKDKLV